MLGKHLKSKQNIKNYLLMLLFTSLMFIILLPLYMFFGEESIITEIASIILIAISAYIEFYFIIKKTYNAKVNTSKILKYVLFIFLLTLLFIITTLPFTIIILLVSQTKVAAIISAVITSVLVYIFIKLFLKIKFYSFSEVKKGKLKEFSKYMWNKNKKIYNIIIMSIVIIVGVLASFTFVGLVGEILKGVLTETSSLSQTAPLKESSSIVFVILYIFNIILSYIDYCLGVDIYGSYLVFEEIEKIRQSELEEVE